MNQDVIVVTKREKIGKIANREIRKQGCIPAVIYGLKGPAVAIAIPAKTVARIIASETGLNSMVQLQCEGAEAKDHAIIKEVQRDPITSRLVHVDFMRVDPNHKVRVHVPIQLKGTPVGIKEGGILDFVHRTIEVECLPSLIPARVEVNVEALAVGDAIRMDQVQLAASLTLIGDAHNVICAVHGKQAEEEEVAAPAEGEEAAAPAANAKAK